LISALKLNATFENVSDTTFSKSVAGIGTLFIDDNFINFPSSPAGLSKFNNVRYGVEYQNDYFESFFTKYNFYYMRKIKSIGLGIFFSDMMADDNEFDYSEKLLKIGVGGKISSMLLSGINLNFFNIDSSFINSIGFNSDINFLIMPIENLFFTLFWENCLDLPLYWGSGKEEFLNRRLSVSTSYRIIYKILSLNLLLKYNLSDITISRFTISDKQDEKFGFGLVSKVYNRFYLSAGISDIRKSFGVGVETEYFTLYFANDIKSVGSQQSLNLSFKGGI